MMAPFASLSREEKIGLWVAGGAHVALAAALMLQDSSIEPYTPPERIDVSLATQVSLESTAPDPSQNPAAAMAPTLSDQPVPDPAPQVEVSEPDTLPEPPKPPPVQSSSQRSTARTTPETPAPTTTRSRPDRQQTTSQQSASSRLNDTFLEGMSDSSGTEGSAGDRPSAQQQASIDASIIRQLKPHWNPPSGVEVERLVTVVRFRLNRDGSLNGNPEVVDQTGVTDANRAQAVRHQEQAIRAARLASPFNLPERFYSGWSVVTSNFDNRLAQ